MDTYEIHAEAYVSLVREGLLRLLQSRLARRLLRLAGDVAGRKVLDAGCGQAHLARLLARHRAAVVGVEISPRLIEAARCHSKSHELHTTFLEADIVGSARISRDAPHDQCGYGYTGSATYGFGPSYRDRCATPHA